jgi:branched-chain amino acid transport system ATP-binding protein
LAFVPDASAGARLDRYVILKLDNLSRSFGSLKAVDGVELEVARGEALGIIGPNGAGKSTLFNLITGLLQPDGGTVHFDGHDVTAAPPRVRCIAGIGRSFQIPHPFENLTVFENLLVAAIHGRRQREADVVESCGDILQRTGLIGFANRRAGTLNLLGRKRLELARALASGPRLLLLDEIAGGLTEAECIELVALIGDIKQSGVTIVWIEHIVHALLAVVSRLAVLNFGRKIIEGEPRAVMASDQVREIYMGIAA